MAVKNSTRPQWTPDRAILFTEQLRETGRTGGKLSVPRVAKKADVSTDFIQSLCIGARDFRTGKYTVRSRSLTLRAIAAVGGDPKEYGL